MSLPIPLHLVPQPVVLLDEAGRVCATSALARDLVEGEATPPLALDRLVDEETAAQIREVARQPAGFPTWSGRGLLRDGRPVDLTLTADDAGRPALWMVPDSSDDPDRLLSRLVAHTADVGQAFFEQLVVHLAGKLGARYALLGAFDESQRDRIRTLALCADGVLADPIVYDLRGTPCDDVLQSGICYYPSAVPSLFPDDRLLADMGVESYLGVPLLDRTGEALGILVLMHDAPLDLERNPVGLLRLFAARAATEMVRVRAEREAEQQRAFADSLLDQVAALVIVVDDQGCVIRANRTVTEVTGWSEDELVGERFAGSVAPPEAEDTLATAALRDAVAQRVEDWPTRGGGSRRIRWVARRIADVNGSGAARLLVTGVDLTALESARRERDALQDRLRRAQRLESLGRLAGGVAHDFNNLLLAILGYADLIETAPDDAAEVAECAAEIRRAGDQAAALTQQLLAFGRREHLDRRRIEIGDVIRNATAVIRPLLAHAVRLEVDLPEEPLPVRADPGRLEQVVVNLAVNARDAMPDGGALYLVARRLADHEIPGDLGSPSAALVEVRDTGSGIPDEILPHIFEPFFTTKELGRGTGLGLASVYGTVEQHGGLVDVSTSPEEGTSFRIVLPLDETAVASADDDAPARRATIRGRILVAEDEATVRSLVGRVLEQAGYEVDLQPNGRRAWERLLDRPRGYDLVLADLIMPEMSGLELVRQIRQHLPDVPVLLTSGFVGDVDQVPDDVRVLAKPYLPDELVASVASAMRAGPPAAD